MKIKEIKRIDPKPSRCIEVDSTDRLFAAGGANGAAFISHNSVAQRNIIFSCIMRPDRWRFLGIDLKKVELSSFRAYSNVVLGIATTLEDALTVIRFAQETMMKRYAELEQLGLNNFLDLPEAGQALMVMIDEAGELLSPGGTKTDEGKAQDELKGEAMLIISSIARLGRAAGVHIVVATQRPDATLIPGETKANLGVRLNCGKTLGNASSMILESSEGSRVKPYPRGRLYLGIYGAGDHGQGFFAEPEWIDEWLESKGMNPDGTLLGNKRSRLAKITDMDAELSGDLDSKEGVDNTSVINKIRAEEGLEPLTEEEMLDEYKEDNDDDYVEPSEVDEEVSKVSAKDEAMGRPDLTGKNSNDLHRPEDDWDDDLENAIEMNT